MTNDSQPRQIALLIDAENVGASSGLINNILRVLKRFGQIEIRHIYGDWSNPSLKSWQSVALEHRLYQQHFGSIAGKNSTDIAMVIGAMDILYEENVDAFCLVTSDRDFTALAMRMRHSRKGVIGIGRRSTHADFVAACNRFIYLEDLMPEPAKNLVIQPSVPSPNPVVTPAAPLIPATPQNTGIVQDKQKIAELYALASQAMELTREPTGWVGLGEFGNRLYQVKSDFDAQYFCQTSKLSDLIQTYPQLFELAITGKTVMVRLIGKKSPTKAPSVPNKPDGLSKKEAQLYALSQKAMSLTSVPTGWVKMEEFASRLHQVKPGFRMQDYSETSKLKNMIQAYPNLFQTKTVDKYFMVKLL